MELSRVSNLLSNTNSETRVNKGIMFTKKTAGYSLMHPDTFLQRNNFKSPVLKNSYSGNISFSPGDIQLQQLQSRSVNSALGEWQSGVREDLGKDHGRKVDKYYYNSHFTPGGGGWCGFFVAYNYAQAGFKYSPQLAGAEKARDFFLYRQYTNRSKEKNEGFDQLREQQKVQGSQRQFFMLEESPSVKYIKNYRNLFSHYNADANTFNYRTLPIRPGDTILYNTGNSGGHVGMVVSYDPSSGRLETVEGNSSGTGPDGKKWSQAVVRKTLDLTDPRVRAKIEGFGRPAAGDFS